MYRGEPAHSVLELRDCPRDRQPRNTRPAYHRAADDWFLRRFGIRYRSGSLFCTGSLETAAQYGEGKARFIYPVGEFRICWSPRVHDLFMWTFNRSVPEFVSFLENEADYREGDLCEAIASDCEIMVSCARFFSLASSLDCLSGMATDGRESSPGSTRDETGLEGKPR